MATQADDVEAVAAAEAQFLDGLARQLRLRRQRDFGQPQLVGVQAVVGGVERHGLQAQRLVGAEQADGRAGEVHQQHVAGFQLGVAGGHEQQGAELALALDGDDVDAVLAAQLELVQGLPRERVGAYPQASFALAEVVGAGQVGEGQARRRGGVVTACAAEPAAGGEHVEHAQDQHGEADGRGAEEAEAVKAGAAQFAVHHHVRRRGHQGEHAADEAGEGQRHHQPRRWDLQPRGDAEHDRDEDGDHAGGAHHRAEPGDAEHEQHQQAGFAAAGAGHQRVAQAVGDAGAHQAVADDEQRGDQHDAGVAEAGQGLFGAEHAAERQGHEGQQGDGVHAWAVAHEEGDDHQQQAEYPDELRDHGGAPGWGVIAP